MVLTIQNHRHTRMNILAATTGLGCDDAKGVERLSRKTRVARPQPCHNKWCAALKRQAIRLF